MDTESATLGVEQEFLVVDASGYPAHRGTELVAAGEDDQAEGDLQPELVRCQVETTTSICHDAEQVSGQLADLRHRVDEQARARGLRLVPTGTPVLADADDWPPISGGERYREIADWFGAVARTSNTCGCHVHVAIPDRATGVEVSNRVRPWLPMLLALTANSPFHQGADTSCHSWRYVLWSHWPTAGPPPCFASLDHYESSLDALMRVGAILDRRGVYWDIRLSEHQPTLEFRVCDVTQTPGEAAAIAALIRAAVATAIDDFGAAYQLALPLPQEVLRANLWRAAREGLAGECLHPVTGELAPMWTIVGDFVDWVRPALKDAGDDEFVAGQLAWLRDAGDGATRQRAAFAQHQRLTDVVDRLAGRS